MDWYIKSVAPDFRTIVPQLLQRGYKVSICTFTDEHYYQENSGDDRFPMKEYRAGNQLIEAFLAYTFPDENIRNAFINIGFNPSIHKDMNVPSNKNYHLDKLLEIYNQGKNGVEKLKLSECILFDDTTKNITEAKGYKAVKVPDGNRPQDQKQKGFWIQAIDYDTIKNKNL